MGNTYIDGTGNGIWWYSMGAHAVAAGCGGSTLIHVQSPA